MVGADQQTDRVRHQQSDEADPSGDTDDRRGQQRERRAPVCPGGKTRTAGVEIVAASPLMVPASCYDARPGKTPATGPVKTAVIPPAEALPALADVDQRTCTVPRAAQKSRLSCASDTPPD
jgi:hypothetical protein